MRHWRLDSAGQSLILSGDAGLARVVYWGARLGDVDLDAIFAASVTDVTGGMLDAPPPISVCPEGSRAFAGQVGIVIRAADGAPILPRFTFDSAEESGACLSLVYKDSRRSLRYVAEFSVSDGSEIITARARLESESPIFMDWLAAPVIPAPQHCGQMIDYAGRWCGEFQEVSTEFSAGIRMRDNRTGRSGHEHYPSLLLTERGGDSQGGSETRHSARFRGGEVYGFHYGWSGGHRMICEELPDGRRQVQFGSAFGGERVAGKSFETAPLYLCFSADGLNGVARAFQRHVRDEIVRLPNPNAPRPVHYNCWEAVYHSHDLAELKTIATLAAKLGAERFVLDDGWFAGRNDDTSSLGDWRVDGDKYPDGLTPLIDYIHGEGMDFGLWFEPEMINPESALYKAHPDWILGEDDQPLGRGQLVLDMAKPEVRDYLFDSMSALLTEYPIAYIKWDHNRVLPHPDAAQTRGTYDLLDRIRSTHPQVEIESCASGGGRADYGMLSRTHRVWLSDSNDALERVRIQRNAAAFLPSSVMGSHVGPAICHTSGRNLSLSFRAWVAAQGHFGFELDPRELSDSDSATLSKITAWWKANRDWLMGADVLRLNSGDAAVLANLHLSADETRFALFVNKCDSSAQIAPRPLRLEGLDGGADYALQWVNGDDCPRLSQGKTLLKTLAGGGEAKLNGGYLMAHGLHLPWQMPCSTFVFIGEKK